MLCIFFTLFLCHNLYVIIVSQKEEKGMTDTQIVKDLVGLEPELNMGKVEEVKKTEKL